MVFGGRGRGLRSDRTALRPNCSLLGPVGERIVSRCLRMRMNVTECVRMCQNALDWWATHTYRRREEKLSGLKAKLTWTLLDGLDGLWACQCSTHALHVIQVFTRLLSVPFLFDSVSSVGWFRVPATMMRGRCARRTTRLAPRYECVRMRTEYRMRQNAFKCM